MNNTNRNILLNILNGTFASIMLNIIHPYFAKYAQRLGATDFEIAYIHSLPALISVFVLIPGAILIDCLGNKQRTTAFMLLSARLFYLAMAAIPILPIDPAIKPIFFISLIALQNLPGSIYSLGYQSCIADFFDKEYRGRAMALRNRFSDAAKIGITLLSGFIMTIPEDSNILQLYQVFFLIAFIFGMGELITFLKMKITSSAQTCKQNKLQTLKEALIYTFTNKDYRAFLLCSLVFYFGWQIGWPLFSIYMIRNLQATEIWIAATTVAGGLAAIFTATGWIRFADKHGNYKTIIIALFLMSITPFLYVITTELWHIVVFNILIGFSITGTTLLFFNIMLDRTPTENRTTIIAIFQTITAISAAFTPLIGVSIAQHYTIHIALIITGILRLTGAMSFVILYFTNKNRLKSL